MRGKLTYLTIPHYPGEKPAGFPELGDYMEGRVRTRIKAGERVGERYFDGIEFQLRKETGNQLTDFLYSVDGLLVISPPVRQLLTDQGLGPEDVEFVPFKLKDKKGKPVAKPYCVANPLRRVACLDTERSDCKLFTNPVSGEQKWMIETVVLREDAIPPDARLFRLAEKPSHTVLIRSDLLDLIRKAGLTGLVARAQGEPR